jgi:enediyne biosynthesis protein E4
VRLEGVHTNRDAIGARVEIEVDGRTLSQTVMPTRSYLSQVELPVTFGLGAQDKITAARVIWPGGGVQVLDPPAVDQTITVREAGLRVGSEHLEGQRRNALPVDRDRDFGP